MGNYKKPEKLCSRFSTGFWIFLCSGKTHVQSCSLCSHYFAVDLEEVTTHCRKCLKRLIPVNLEKALKMALKSQSGKNTMNFKKNQWIMQRFCDIPIKKKILFLNIKTFSSVGIALLNYLSKQILICVDLNVTLLKSNLLCSFCSLGYKISNKICLQFFWALYMYFKDQDFTDPKITKIR